MSSGTPSADDAPDNTEKDAAARPFGAKGNTPGSASEASEPQSDAAQAATPAPPLPPLGTPATPPVSGSGSKPAYKPPTRPAPQAHAHTPPAQGASAPAAGDSELSPEKAIGLAFVGGFIAARLLKRLRG